MIESPLLELQLRGLHLSTVLANYRRLLGEHAEPLPYLSDLISLESAKRQENGVRARITAAHFPTIKTIESFDFTLQPELPKAKLLEHFDGKFVEAHRNLIFSGPPGVGKSHILSALGLAMCMRGYRVLFTTAAALLMKLIAAKRTATLERHYRNLDRDLHTDPPVRFECRHREQTVHQQVAERGLERVAEGRVATNRVPVPAP